MASRRSTASAVACWAAASLVTFSPRWSSVASISCWFKACTAATASSRLSPATKRQAMDRAGPKPVATPLSLSLRDNARKKLRISVIQSSYACIPAQTQMPSQGLSHAERTEASPPYHPQQADAQRILARMTRPGKPDLCLSAVPASRRCDRAPGAGKSACARGKGGGQSREPRVAP